MQSRSFSLRTIAIYAFVTGYLLLQIGVPILGLWNRHASGGGAARFSWHMFSVIPDDVER